MARNSLQRSRQLPFIPVELDHGDAIRGFTSAFLPYSDFNFFSLYAWGGKGSSSFALLNDALFIRLADYVTAEPTLSVLANSDFRSHAGHIAAHCRSEGRTPTFSLLPEPVARDMVSALGEMGLALRLDHDPANDDYVLSSHRLATLNGSEYSDLRSKLARFDRAEIARFEDDAVHAFRNREDELRALGSQWAAARTASGREVADELQAFERFVGLASQVTDSRLRILGMHLRGRLVAAIGYELVSSEWAIGHFLKIDTKVRFAYSKIVHHLSRHLADRGVSFINIEQDLGLAGLREAKSHLRPIEKLRKFKIQILDGDPETTS